MPVSLSVQKMGSFASPRASTKVLAVAASFTAEPMRELVAACAGRAGVSVIREEDRTRPMDSLERGSAHLRATVTDPAERHEHAVRAVR